VDWKVRKEAFCFGFDIERNEFLSALVCICVSLSLCLLLQVIILILNGLARGTLRSRTTNHLGEDSYYRGSIVNTRGVCSGVLLVRRDSPTAL
jgi:hypothetical protein